MINLQNGQTLTQNMQLQFQPNELAKISGKISVDNQIALAGVLLKVSGRINKATQTGLDGSFNFESLEAGYNYTVTPTLSHYFFLPTNRSFRPLSQNKVDQNFLASYYGDISGNQEVSSFDGSLVLRISAKKVVTPYFSNFPRDSLAADVSGNRTVSSFDASLIFRYAVGLITLFPAEEKTTSPAKSNQIETTPLLCQQDWSTPGMLRLVLITTEALSFFALDAELHYQTDELEPLAIQPAASLTGFYREWQGQNGRLNIAFAGVEQAQCQDTLLTILFRSLSNKAPFNAYYTWQQLNLDEIARTVVLNQEQAIPQQFDLSQNYPNPFNQSTIFQINLPQVNGESTARLLVAIYNLLGQKVKSLYDRPSVPGIYTLSWPGDTDDNRATASGVYLLRVEYAQFHAVQKMVLIR